MPFEGSSKHTAINTKRVIKQNIKLTIFIAKSFVCCKIFLKKNYKRMALLMFLQIHHTYVANNVNSMRGKNIKIAI